MKTARITFLIQHGIGRDDEALAYPAVIGDRDSSFVLQIKPMAACLIIGEPRIELDKHHRCSMAHAQLEGAIRGIRTYGGKFANRLADLIECADSDNSQKLLDTFHDLLWNYVPMGATAC